MGLQLVSADYLHEDGITYRIRRDTLELSLIHISEPTRPY